MKLAGKVALVTGAQQGIGAAIARVLAAEGADVAVSWLDDRAGAEAVARDIAQAGRRAHLLRTDVSKVAEIEAMVAETVRVLGAPDILVNNAGVYPRVPLLEMKESDWDYLMDINLKAGCFAAIAVAKALIAAGRKGGSIINLSSQAIRGAVRGVHYSASKGGVVSMTRAMALELAPHGIRVNAIAPGYIETDINRTFFASPAGEAVVRRIPQRRLGRPEDLDGALLLLASEAGQYMTGSVITVDGGHVVSPL